MNSVSVGGKADINAIVNDQCCPVECYPTQLPRTAQKSTWLFRLGFVAKLDQGRACRNQLFRITRYRRDRIWLRREAGEVDDGVKTGQDHESLVYRDLVRRLGTCATLLPVSPAPLSKEGPVLWHRAGNERKNAVQRPERNRTMRPVVLMILMLAICGGCNSGPGSSPQQASKPVEPSKCEIASMTNADSPWQYSEKKNEMDGRETTIAGLRNFGTGQQIILRCSGSDLRSDALCSRGKL